MQILTLTQADRKRTDTTDFLFLGSTPHEEECTQAGYKPEQLKDGIFECTALINQLIRQYGEMPANSLFYILEQEHDFGIYHEAIVFYSTDEEAEEETESEVYAFKCENLPGKWDSEALKELRNAGHTKYQPAKIIKLFAA